MAPEQQQPEIEQLHRARYSAAAQLLLPEAREQLEAGAFHDLRHTLETIEPSDVADLLSELLATGSAPEAAVMFRLLRRDEASEAFAELDPDAQSDLIDELGAERAVRVVESLDPDDRAEFLDELPSEAATRLIARLSPAERRRTQAILGYAPDTVGRLMTPDYVRIRKTNTVADTLEHIRRYGKDAETVHWVYVIDDEFKLVDDLHIRTLLLADPQTHIADLCDDRFISLTATDDQEEAVRVMNRYDRTALPVVDLRGVLVGIVTIDDVADVAEEEATEDIHKLGGLEALERPYLQTDLRQMLKKRGGWLAALFVLQLLTIGVMGYFDEALEAAVVLALFVPLIISSGGNTGTQAASLLIRALAVQELTPRDWRRILIKEVSTGLLLGATLGGLGALSVIGLDIVGVAETEHAGRLALTVGIAVFAIVLWAVSLGSMFPLLLSKLGFDPATISSPLVATVMDVSGLLIYFGIALLLLTGTILPS